MTMNRRLTAGALIACMMLSVTACSGHTRATVIQAMESFETSQQSTLSEETSAAVVQENIMGSVTLKGSGDDTFPFSYDSDVLTYTGQGGNFFFVGSSPTECYLHIMVQSGDETYEDAFQVAQGRIVEEYTLKSGRRAFCYKTSDANTLHVLIEAKDLVESGNCLVKLTIGSPDAWYYSQEQIANMVDDGFALSR